MAKEFNLIDLEINPQIAHMLSEEVVKKYRVLPLKLENNILEVAMVNPDNLEAIDEIKLLTGCEIKPVSVADNQLQATIEKHFRIEETAKQDLIDMRLAGLKAVQQKGQKIIENLERAEDQPIIKLLNSTGSSMVTILLVWALSWLNIE